MQISIGIGLGFYPAATSKGWSPYILPNWAAGYDASVISSLTYDGSNLVSRWKDISGNSPAGQRDLVQATGANQPVLTIAAGANRLTFDGTNDYMKAAPFSLSQPETVYFVGSQVTWTINEQFYDGNTSNSMTMYQNATTPTINGFAGNAIGASTDLAVGTRGIKTLVFNGASSVNRTNLNAAVTGNAGASNAGGFTLGARGDGAANWANITVNEVLIYSAAHSTDTQNQIIAYLAAKWGV